MLNPLGRRDSAAGDTHILLEFINIKNYFQVRWGEILKLYINRVRSPKNKIIHHPPPQSPHLKKYSS